MPTNAIPVFHRVRPSQKPFAQVIEALQSQLGRITAEEQKQIVVSSTSADQFAKALEPFIGPSGFIIFHEFDHGMWLTKFFKPLKAKLYVLGNPFLAKDLLVRNAAAGPYVPTRLCVYEDDQGTTQLAYDELSDFVSGFHNPDLTTAAEAVDRKLEALVDLAAG
jgi:uncharacterized protein (DUF302 family)